MRILRVTIKDGHDRILFVGTQVVPGSVLELVPPGSPVTVQIEWQEAAPS